MSVVVPPAPIFVFGQNQPAAFRNVNTQFVREAPPHPVRPTTPVPLRFRLGPPVTGSPVPASPTIGGNGRLPPTAPRAHVNQQRARAVAALPVRRQANVAVVPLAPARSNIDHLTIMPTSQEAGTMPQLGEIQGALPTSEDNLQAMVEKQFRMLRYDCTVSFRAAIWGCIRDLMTGSKENSLARILEAEGGMYAPRIPGCDTSAVPLISDIRFTGITLNRQADLAFYVSARAPPGPARNPDQSSRFGFWRHGKRLMSGGMVALLSHAKGATPDVRMAVVSSEVSFPRKGEQERRDTSTTISFSISFPNPADADWAMRQVLLRDCADQPIRFLLENPILYISFYPFLRGLQSSDMPNLEPSLLRSIVHTSASPAVPRPPTYTTLPGFEWDLGPLLKPDIQIPHLKMLPGSTSSVDNARRRLRQESVLDPSQADAIIDSLQQSLFLCQGPPGAGKTYTGVQLLRLFVLNNVGPIIVMAQTNHALDNILRALYDTGVTKDIVRLGAGSEDPILQGLSMRKRRTKLSGRKGNPAGKLLTEVVNDMSKLEQEMRTLSIRTMANNTISSDQIQTTLSDRFGIHQFRLNTPPAYIQAMADDLALEDGWIKAGRGGTVPQAATIWELWAEGADIKRVMRLAERAEGTNDLADALADLGVEATNGSARGYTTEAWTELFQKGSWDPATAARTKALSDKDSFLHHFKLPTLPTFPKTDRPTPELLQDPDVWFYSTTERRRFRQHLEEQTRLHQHAADDGRIKQLVAKYAAKRVQYDIVRDKLQTAALQGVRVVGCTTNGAARLKSIIQTLSPTVLLVEEAGQALEAHILAALSPSIQHLIQIGDPQQLRCITNCHKLSVESTIGAANFRLNESMMERLSGAGYPMTQLKVQRRMRPQICSLIRAQIYPELQDHDLVKVYPDVKGATKNVYFLDHRHKETANGEGGVKKSNPWEAKMAAELALFFAKQGCYPEEKGIVILCAYAGQVMEVKKCLEGRAKIKTGEKEKQALARAGINADIFSDASGPGLTVMVRTIDSFQGEEADIIILSLVRNAGKINGDYADHSIGFLKTNNRINVAISRAKHGLFILGNAPQLASQSTFWKESIAQLRAEDCVGLALPLCCAVHISSHTMKDVADFKKHAPDGGCSLKCGLELTCSHICPRKCHPADREHTQSTCSQPCLRPRACEHECRKRCNEQCGQCEEIIGVRVLEFGHEVEVRCYQSDERTPIKCPMMITIPGQSCEHDVQIPCGSTGLPKACIQTCGVRCNGCGQKCKEKCLTCQRLSRPRIDPRTTMGPGTLTPPPEIVERSVHPAHQCSRQRENCRHLCRAMCGPNHLHSRPIGASGQDGEACNVDEPPGLCKEVDVVDGRLCDEPCDRSCTHKRCLLPCHMPCEIPPCSEACPEILKCGHPCPSVCSEPCDIQICPSCTAGLQILTADGLKPANHRTRRQVQRRTISHDCGTTVDVAFVDAFNSFDPLHPEHAEKQPSCPSCAEPLTTTRYTDYAKRITLSHFEKHVLHDLSTKAADILHPYYFGLSIEEIDLRWNAFLRGLRLAPAGRIPNQQKLNDLLRLDDDNMVTAQPIPSHIFDDRLGEIFHFDHEVKEVWLQLSQGVCDRYAALQPLISVPINTTSTSPIRIRAIIHSIICRLVLSLLARQFAIALRRFGTRTLELATKANFAAHLADVLSWTVIRSCERDIRIAEYAANRPGIPSSSRMYTAGCRILSSQYISVSVLARQSGASTPERIAANDRLLAKAEGASRDLVNEVKAAGAMAGGVPRDDEEGRVGVLGEMENLWREIRAGWKNGRGFDTAKVLREGTRRMVELEKV